MQPYYSHFSQYVCAHEQIRRWGWNIGATLFFVPLLLKNLRVYYIFHNPTQRKIVSLFMCIYMGKLWYHALTSSFNLELKEEAVRA